MSIYARPEAITDGGYRAFEHENVLPRIPSGESVIDSSAEIGETVASVPNTRRGDELWQRLLTESNYRQQQAKNDAKAAQYHQGLALRSVRMQDDGVVGLRRRVSTGVLEVHDQMQIHPYGDINRYEHVIEDGRMVSKPVRFIQVLPHAARIRQVQERANGEAENLVTVLRSRAERHPDQNTRNKLMRVARRAGRSAVASLFGRQ